MDIAERMESKMVTKKPMWRWNNKMRTKTLKGWGILLLCVGVINHLVSNLAMAFGGEGGIYRTIIASIGYIGFLLIWNVEDKK